MSNHWLSPEYQPGLVSVVVPTYNRADLVECTLGSVSGQSYRPIELIIVDDGSTDDTHACLQRWNDEVQHDSQLTVRLVSQTNQGAPAARNHGLRLSTGEYIQFLDSDDALERHKIERQVAFLERSPSVDFAYGPVAKLERPSMTVYAQSALTRKQAIVKQIGVPTFTTLGPLCRRKLLSDAGPWNETLACGQDWEYFSRICAIGGIPGYVPEAVSLFRADSDPATRVSWSGQLDRLDGYINAMYCRLDTIIEHASSDIRPDKDILTALSWQYLLVSSQAIRHGWQGDAFARIRMARDLSPSLAPKLIASIALGLSGLFGARLAARYLSLHPWLHYKMKALARHVEAWKSSGWQRRL